MTGRDGLTLRSFRLLDGDARPAACGDLDEATRRSLPGNYLRLIASQALTKLGDALVNPKTVLTWLALSLQVPAAMVALLVPVREAGSMLLQFWLAGWVSRFRLRRRVWVIGALLQALAVFGMATAALLLEGALAGLALLTGLSAFALARSICSIASKDVLGRTIPKTQRGRTTGWAASAAGVATLGVGLAGFALSAESVPLTVLLGLLLAAAGLWLLAAWVFNGIDEPALAPSDSARQSPLARLGLLRRDVLLRRFVLTRALLLCSALSTPYYVLLAKQHSSGGYSLLFVFVLLGGLATMLGGAAWGHWADRSSRKVMNIAALIAAAVALMVFIGGRGDGDWMQRTWTLPLAFFLVSLAHEGVRIGRKTWIVNIAEGQRRTDYVAVSNSVIGLALLLAGALSAILAAWSPELALLGLGLAGAAGAALGWRLPEAESHAAQ